MSCTCISICMSMLDSTVSLYESIQLLHHTHQRCNDVCKSLVFTTTQFVVVPWFVFTVVQFVAIWHDNRTSATIFMFAKVNCIFHWALVANSASLRKTSVFPIAAFRLSANSLKVQFVQSSPSKQRPNLPEAKKLIEIGWCFFGAEKNPLPMLFHP